MRQSQSNFLVCRCTTYLPAPMLPHRPAAFPLCRALMALCGWKSIYRNSPKPCTSATNKQRRTTLPYWGSPPEHRINRKHCSLYYRGASDWWRYCFKQKLAIHRGELMLAKLCRCLLWPNLTHGYTFFGVLRSWKHPTAAGLWNVPWGYREQRKNKTFRLFWCRCT